jgi:transcriptional pleiotropic regulator of transition state genes
MANGIVRKLDELGRITIPIEIRRRHGIIEGDRLGINLSGNIIRISKVITGMSRPVDDLGRLVIPKEYRRTLGIGKNQPVDTWVEVGVICLAKYGNSCAICGSTEELLDVEGIHICRKCAYKVVDAVMEG